MKQTFIIILAILALVANLNAMQKDKTQNFDFDDYPTSWNEVEKFEQEGKPKSANEIVGKILAQARNEQNSPQIVKALLHQFKYMMVLEEDSELTIVKRIKEEILNTDDLVAKAFLNSILASAYWDYYQDNRYKFLERSANVANSDEDFRAWDLRFLLQNVTQHYFASLENPAALQAQQVKDLDAIVYLADEKENYRPTAYDLLSHRAIDFFMNSQSGLTEGLQAFSLNDYKLFQPTNAFIKINFKEDKNALDYGAIKLFQEVLAFRISEKDVPALIDADLKRLAYEYQKSNSANKNEQYINALSALAKQYQSDAASAQVNFKLAEFYNNNAAKDNDTKDYKIKAVALCEAMQKQHPNSMGADNCKALLYAIQKKNLNVETEKVVVPNVAYKALVTYSNIDKIYLKVVALTESDLKNEHDYNNREKRIRQLAGRKAVQTWSQTIEDPKDYFSHSTEIAMQALPIGDYAIIASTDESFGENLSVIERVTASIISYITKKASGKLNVFVLNRKNGQPLSNAKVDVYKSHYDYNKRKQVYTKLQSLQTDNKGYISINNNESRNNFFFDIQHNDDRLYEVDHHYINKPYHNEPKWRTQTYFFTDRSIYRPGQTVYFKGIMLERKGDETRLLKQQNSIVVFKDVNYQEVAQLELTTNEFGSFQGSFTAPSGGLLGNMHITNNSGQAYFSVEEYKRPTFEVLMDTLEGGYSLNQKVTLTGKGQSYAGAALIDAQVKYRVVREVRYPYWYYSWRRPAQQGSSKEIANGTTTTDAQGKFSIDFTTLPDASVPKENQPQFNYKVYVDIVDISGETRSAEKSITAGYVGINLSMQAPATINRNESNSISISTTNLDGNNVDAQVAVKLYRLVPPASLKKNRLWGMPDIFTLSKAQHDAQFPNELYKNENDFNTWEKVVVNTYNVNTAATNSIELPANLLTTSGMYLLEGSTKDDAGNEVKAQSTFKAISANDRSLALPTALEVYTDKDSYEPGETAIVNIGSSLQNANVIYEISFDGKLIERQYLNLNNNIQQIRVPINSKQRGGLQVQCALVRNNRVYTSKQMIVVPFEDHALKVEWMRFRDLLEPGQEEEWQLKIKGPKGDLVASEVLATMYDKSLDYFKPHAFNFPVNLNPHIASVGNFNHGKDFQAESGNSWFWNNVYHNYKYISYDELDLFGFYLSRNNYRFGSYSLNGVKVRGEKSSKKEAAPAAYGNADVEEAVVAGLPEDMLIGSLEQDEADDAAFGGKGGDKAATPTDKKADFTPRTNLNETAFFFPQLKTNSEGEVILKFTMPEALTTWQFNGFAHNQQLQHAIFSKTLKTQKELMVTPNFPRFFRDGDKITVTAKIDNLSDQALSGNAQLILKDALTDKIIDQKLLTSAASLPFTIDSKGSMAVSWNLKIPSDVQAVTYEVRAITNSFSDGVQSTLPVLTNRMLVTETMPIWLKGAGSKTFEFNKLKNTNSKTLKHHQLTLEYSSNPVWYAVQALPYLMEYPYECTEQLFSRYYANSLATHIVEENSVIQKVFKQWASTNPDALLSNLEKNQELKALLIEETPWLRNAQNESERKKRIALLFDLNKMRNELGTALTKVQERQTPNGGFTWFPGMRDSRYITQHIMTSIAHLQQLEVRDTKTNAIINSMVEKAIPYLDDRIAEDYRDIKKYSKDWKKSDHLSAIQIQYLYMRSSFQNIPQKHQEAFDYFYNQAKKYWLKKGLYNQGMIAIALHKYDDSKIAQNIMASIKEQSIVSDEMGMYWKSIEQGGYYWYNAPIESHALLIEAFSVVTDDADAVNEMKVWLLKQKQVQDWRTTKATTEAIFALLLRGDDWLKNTDIAKIKVGGKIVDPKAMDATLEPGTGYFKVKWDGSEVKKDMATVEVTSTNNAPSWGAMYWQYFEDLDAITTFEDTPLQLKKVIFLETVGNNGPEISPVTSGTALKPGDKLKIRIELRVDRNMEYVHMKDMRASGLEPINVLSQYKYQDGLGYYESTKDAATNFFMDYLPKGVYVFEYPLRVSHKGDFSNGITTIQSMYAPEFASHSEGVRIEVE